MLDLWVITHGNLEANKPVTLLKSCPSPFNSHTKSAIESHRHNIIIIIVNFSDYERRVILMGMKHWEDNTCIRFRPRRSSDRNSIYIMSGQVAE